MGISPRHGSHAALPIACDALNARTVAVRKYHCIFCVSLPANRYTCFPARCWSLGCPGGDNLARIASWRTRRMARRKRNVSDLPYAAPPLSCAAFFFKVQNGCAMPVQLPVSVTRFIVQHRITKLLKSTLFVKLPAIRFHILTSFLVGKLVVLPPFRGAIRRF